LQGNVVLLKQPHDPLYSLTYRIPANCRFFLSGGKKLQKIMILPKYPRTPCSLFIHL